MALLKENKLQHGFRVYRNPIMDALSRAHPALPAIIWIPFTAVMLGYAATQGLDWFHYLWAIPAGVLLWTLSEYALHRWFFHWRPRSPFLAKMQYWVHEHHHRYQEWDRLVAPPLMAGPIFVAFFPLFWLAFGGTLTVGPFAAMWPFISGFIFGYLAYDYTHFATHFAGCKKGWMKARRKFHYQHHFAFPDRWYGISCPLWDYVFGTYPRKGETVSRNTSRAREATAGEKPHAMDVYAEHVRLMVEEYAKLDGRSVAEKKKAANPSDQPAADGAASSNGAAASSGDTAAESAPADSDKALVESR